MLILPVPMNELMATTSGGMAGAIPRPRVPLHVRPATIDDLPFIDRLQKLHAHQVGWMPRQQLEGKIAAGQVIVAEEVRGRKSEVSQGADLTSDLRTLTSVPVGYCIGHDQYFKRDDVGIIYQMNVVPGRQRGLIGATLVKAMFERAAYGCRLFCCWCAQDIAANRFWESLGFIPLAYRAGSREKGRVHIFWQRRVRAGDTSTPYWFPAQTTSGSIREDRIVLPIPPGMHWSEAKPIVLPGNHEPKRLAAPRQKKVKLPAIKPSMIAAGGLRFVVSGPVPEAQPKRERRQKVKNDPKLVAAARELRDRWLERVNLDPSLLSSRGKYDVGRGLPDGFASASMAPAVPLLSAA